MLTSEQINQLLNVDEEYKAPEKLMNILFDKEKREKLFCEFLEYEKNVGYDWFHIYFQDEYADRKKKKQDFTPNTVSKLLSTLVGNGPGMNSDIAAGTGGLTIQKWYLDQRSVSPFEYYPRNYFYQCEELSDRALPFLLFNLMIRGMNASVIHGDSLTREAKQVYFIQNDKDDHMSFSSLNVMPHSKDVEKYFDIRKWLEEPVKHIESPLNLWGWEVEYK